MQTQLWMLDYGHQVRVLEGKNQGRTGYIVMSSRFGDVGINTKKKPTNDYQIRTFPPNLEIISMENPYQLKPLFKRGLTNFDFAKLKLLNDNPKTVLDNPEYFDELIINAAKRHLENKSLISS